MVLHKLRVPVIIISFERLMSLSGRGGAGRISADMFYDCLIASYPFSISGLQTSNYTFSVTKKKKITPYPVFIIAFNCCPYIVVRNVKATVNHCLTVTSRS